jgi:DNA-binding NtrC family response regulator
MLPTVLLVDDDRNVIEGLRRALRREPWEILEAGDALAALRVMATRPVEVVVTDQAMPDMSGALFLERVRKEYPETVRIMLTGYGSLDLARRAINDGGVFRFYTKPCNAAELAAAIRAGLEHRTCLVEGQRALRASRGQGPVGEARGAPGAGGEPVFVGDVAPARSTESAEIRAEVDAIRRSRTAQPESARPAGRS